jgi:hypothetical protein
MKAITQYDALHWAWTVCKEEKNPADIIKNMLEIITHDGEQDFRAILEERKRGLK